MGIVYSNVYTNEDIFSNEPSENQPNQVTPPPPSTNQTIPNDHYQKKYLKYKMKYLNLKKSSGLIN